MAVVIEEVIGEVQTAPRAAENPLPAASARPPRPDVATELRRAASLASRVHAD